MSDMTHKARAIELRKRARALQAQADILDPPYPCHGCLMGWGNASADKVETCHDTCEKLKDYRAKQKGHRPLEEFVAELEEEGEL